MSSNLDNSAQDTFDKKEKKSQILSLCDAFDSHPISSNAFQIVSVLSILYTTISLVRAVFFHKSKQPNPSKNTASGDKNNNKGNKLKSQPQEYMLGSKNNNNNNNNLKASGFQSLDISEDNSIYDHDHLHHGVYEDLPPPRLGHVELGVRALESQRQDRLFNDPIAAQLLGKETLHRMQVLIHKQDSAQRVILTRIFDDYIIRTLSNYPQISQVVFLGAAFDTRRFRITFPKKCMTFLVDREDAIEEMTMMIDTLPEKEKEKYLSNTPHNVLVKADVSQIGWDSDLIVEGFSFLESTLWVIENAHVQFTESQLRVILRTIKNLSTEGGRICLSLWERPPDSSFTTAVTTQQQQPRFAVPSCNKFLKRAGFKVKHMVPVQNDRIYFGRQMMMHNLDDPHNPPRKAHKTQQPPTHHTAVVPQHVEDLFHDTASISSLTSPSMSPSSVQKSSTSSKSSPSSMYTTTSQGQQQQHHFHQRQQLPEGMQYGYPVFTAMSVRNGTAVDPSSASVASSLHLMEALDQTEIPDLTSNSVSRSSSNSLFVESRPKVVSISLTIPQHIMYTFPSRGRVLVVGDHDLLGNWVPARGIALRPPNTDNPQHCVAQVLFPSGVNKIEYKYVYICGSESTWEAGENHVAQLQHGHIYDLKDEWRA